MAAPTKPWESVPPCCRTPATVNNRMVPAEEMRQATATVPQFQSTLAGGGGMAEQGPVPGAPPIPPRPPAGLGAYGAPFSTGLSPYSGYGGYGTGYSTSYGTGYGAGYGGYGSFGSGFPGYGAASGGLFGRPGGLGAGPESWFIEAAEESSRSTFESIESFVSVFTSISQMMESTYVLIHSSFRAVVGVAEQMGRMRLHLAEVMSAISLVRTLRWVVNFIRRWLGYPELDGADAAWSESGGAALPSSSGDGGGPRPARWPVLVYLLAVLGAPYLIVRMLRGAGARPDTESWKTGAGEHFSAVCSYDFTAGGPGELSVRAGQSLRLAPRRLQPRVCGWVLASDGTAAGLVPTSYVKIRGAVPAGGPGGPSAAAGQPMSQPTPAPAGDGAAAVQKPSPPPEATEGEVKKSTDVSAGAPTTEQACPAPAVSVAASETKPGCCRSKTAVTPVHAPAATPASTVTTPAPTPASPAESSPDRVAAVTTQLPGNVSEMEADPGTVSVTSLKAVAHSAPTEAQK